MKCKNVKSTTSNDATLVQLTNFYPNQKPIGKFHLMLCSSPNQKSSPKSEDVTNSDYVNVACLLSDGGGVNLHNEYSLKYFACLGFCARIFANAHLYSAVWGMVAGASTL